MYVFVDMLLLEGPPEPHSVSTSSLPLSLRLPFFKNCNWYVPFFWRLGPRSPLNSFSRSNHLAELSGKYKEVSLFFILMSSISLSYKIRSNSLLEVNRCDDRFKKLKLFLILYASIRQSVYRSSELLIILFPASSHTYRRWMAPSDQLKHSSSSPHQTLNSIQEEKLNEYSKCYSGLF